MFLLLASLASAQDAQIQVKVPPRGSGMIVVDGAETGVRAPGIISLPPGEHTIQVNGDCTTASETVMVTAGGKTIVNLEPQPVGGFAEIRVSDPAATLTVDGETVAAPAMMPLSCGVHTLEARTDDMTASQELSVEMGGAYRVTLELASIPAVADLPDTETDPEPAPEKVKEPRKVKEPESDPRLTQDTTKPDKDRNGGKIAGGALTVIGAGALVAGGVVRAGALSDYEEFTALDVDGDGTIRTPENTARATALWDDNIGPARSTSMVLFVAGGLCVATGTSVLILVDDQGRPMVGYTGRF
ncbi:MAG: hypothetical protein ACI9VR_001406 [Cognaticolwellia sp.]|jgi:hypothetical protein